MNGQGMDGQGMDGQGMSGNVGSNAGGNIPNMNNMNNTPPNMPNMGGMGMGEMPNMDAMNGMGAMNGMPNMGGINNPPPNMGGMNGNMPNMGGMYNMPPNMNNRMNMGQGGFSLKNIMGVIDKFTKDIDKIVVGIGESIEGALNGSSVTNGINNINQALDNAQRFDGGQQVNQNMEQSKVMPPVMGRSTVSLSNGNEVGKLPEMAESLPSEYGYLAEADNQVVNNIGQMVTPEIHSVLDKQEGMSTSKSKPVNLEKDIETVIENEGVASIENTETIVDSIENNVENSEAIEESTEDILENREVIAESVEDINNTKNTTIENVKASPVSLKKHTNENNDPPVSEVE